MAKIAFLGLGKMGAGMARRLIDAGHETHIYNRDIKKTLPLKSLGAVVHDTPKNAVSGVDAIFIMLSDDDASKSVWCGDDGILSGVIKTGTLAIECSTLSHDWVMQLSSKAKSVGICYIDSPVTGLPDAAASGKLTLFLGGDLNIIKQAQLLLDIISIEQLHFGDIGCGTAYKLIVNLMGSVQIAATAEGLLLAKKCGLDLNLVAKSLASGAVGSPQVARQSGLMVAGNHHDNILFNGKLRLKDTRYGMELAKKFNIDAQLGKKALKAFNKLVDDGYGELAESKIIDSMALKNHILSRFNIY